MKFKAIVQLHGKTATGVEVPASIVEDLEGGKRPPVSVTINGHTYRSSIAPMGGKFMLGISGEQRAINGVNAGDTIEIHLVLDTQAREVSIPEDLIVALNNDAEAKKFFEGLSYSNKLRHVLAIEGAKTSETRQRRIDKAVSLFREGKM